MTISVPDDILEGIRLTEYELRVELALGLYATRKLTFARARRLADLDETAFNALLYERGIMMPYTPEDWAKEFEVIHAFPLPLK